jgi:hypothetical protein
MKNKLCEIAKSWSPIALAATLLIIGMYAVAQQIYRQTANDPQIESTEDYATAFANGKSTDYITEDAKVDIANSLSTFVMVFDKDGREIASSGILDGKSPVPPIGILEAAKDNTGINNTNTQNENRVTWQPKEGVRIAAIVKYYSGKSAGYVLVGRSLRLSEERTARIGLDLLAGWLFTMVATLGIAIILKKTD